MEMLIVFAILVVMAHILGFIWNWIKVSFFMWGTSTKGSSFKNTVAYTIGKAEIEDLTKKD